LSPDGEWITYQSSEAGGNQVFVQRFRDGAFKTRISTTSGSQPEWSADGKKIYYKPFMQVALTFGAAGIQASEPRPIFKDGPHIIPYGSVILPDGKGAIGRIQSSKKQAQEIEVFVNWTNKLP
jgi:hypothetical protein